MTRRRPIRPSKPARGAVERGRPDRGATSAEYALIASLIAVVVIAAVTLLGANTAGLFDRAASSVSSAAG